jgi:hypothetical protein
MGVGFYLKSKNLLAQETKTFCLLFLRQIIVLEVSKKNLPDLFNPALPGMDRTANSDPDVLHANPYIKEAEAGDDAAGGSVQSQRHKVGNKEKQVVAAPVGCPGQSDEDESQIDADEDAHSKLEI